MKQVFGLIGRSGSGKTTLIETMLPLFAAQGLRVNVIKHSHHDVQFEPPGKDSARFRAAGAAEVLLATPYRYAIFHELRHEAEPDLAKQWARLAPADLTLVEGFKHYPIPRLEVFRPDLGQPPLYPEHPDLLAVASDAQLDCPLPVLDLNRPADIVRFIIARALGGHHA
ncbi:molybdopterin-guanine dinucleotide biosynthesis protein B [Andreprevotia lacus DSM 23236]|jgi:molybdopterin-guanine dinucleotide biosynthesis protein B|uniref:Molybdopterin-guanine dinucleotide biosynthesis protein B n=1 Tax=Andreprevotia lacus DSM 23236 TaxID=1121001 RepID=A0A1W1XX46_9NEIS|nr:molybdopterin-guanine dinucleotide biosynthesis protein B [Andreprevotia lacus]SMC28437.1 molybdopterin-guanine dinucleotide biosynthesis protein B [Andreprevotia lacus DSM 23236]